MIIPSFPQAATSSTCNQNSPESLILFIRHTRVLLRSWQDMFLCVVSALQAHSIPIPFFSEGNTVIICSRKVHFCGGLLPRPLPLASGRRSGP
jgi:hypothetical protein